MTCLVVGATGATGRLLVKELLDRGQCVKAVVRTPSKLGEAVLNHPNLSVVEAGISELDEREIADLVLDCDTAVSCLGHNLTCKGLFGPPHRLVADTTRRICEAFRASEGSRPAKFLLMNTAGNSNRDLEEEISFPHRVVILILRLLLPPHADNEKASDYLRLEIGQSDPRVEWAAVRPDTLIDEEDASEYSLHSSPTRSAIFNAGVTSRVNVARFLVDLATNAELWLRWKGQMPVIYNEPAGGS